MKYFFKSGSGPVSLPADWSAGEGITLCGSLSGFLFIAMDGLEHRLSSCTAMLVGGRAIPDFRQDEARTFFIQFDRAWPDEPVPGARMELDEVSASIAYSLFFDKARPAAYLESGSAYLLHRLLDPSPGDLAEPVSRADSLKAYLADRVDQAVCLDDMAAHFDCSPGGLIRLCRRLLGNTPMRVLAEMRMERARRLLEQSDWTIAQVAYGVGFSDPAAFSHFFKRQAGLSPRAFRTNARWLV